MLHRLLTAALLAGLGAGLFSFLAQTAFVAPLIHQAELHEHLAAAETMPSGHGHDATPADGGAARRLLLTLGADLVTGTGFALLLCAAMALRGRPLTPLAGLFWGLAGFAVFSGLPALGLPPLPPGAEAAPVAARQLWWLMTVGCSAAGLALAFLARGLALRLAGIVFLLLPHAIGAPAAPVVEATAVPPALALAFAAVSLAVTAAFWILLGSLCGYFLRRHRPL